MAGILNQQNNFSASNNNLSHNDEFSQREQEQNQEINQSQSNQHQQQEDEELKKKIALYYHTLFQGCLGQWFTLLQHLNYQKLTKTQYLELNMRIQKSLILDFDFESARESAVEDWKIDIERESFDKKQCNAKINGQQLSQINEEQNDEINEENSTIKQDEPFLIEFERLSEFFFDLCLSWCQFLDIETFLFFLNGIFLNITKGSHVNVSTFKEMDEIEVLSIEFFNTLLAQRSKCEELTPETYKDWYTRNFSRQGEIVRSIEKQLYEAFKEKQDNRILDLWIDMPTQSQNQYINQHFDKLDKDFKQISKASKAAELLTNSMNIMEQIKKINLNDKTKRTGDISFKGYGDQTGRTNQNTTDQQSNNQITLVNPDRTKRGPGQTLKIQNTKEFRQNEIERHLLGQLGDRFKHAKLMEISENSYLISADIRLPIFGRPFQLIERTKTSISKRGYLLKMHPEYTSQNRRKQAVQQQDQHPYHTHVIVNNKDLLGQNLLQQDNVQTSGMKNVVYEKIRIKPNTNDLTGNNQSMFPNRKDSLGKETLDSESDAQLAIQQQASSYDGILIPFNQQKMLINQYSEEQKSNINVKVPDLNLLPQTQMSSLIQMGNISGVQDRSGANQTQNIIEDSSLVMAPQNQYINSTQQYSSTQPFQQYNQQYIQNSANIEERAINQVYDRYLQILQQENQPPRVDDILREESFAREFSGVQLDEQQIEAAVMERLQAEEESAEIQEMIAKFYNKFDELHEQSVSLALAKSPNKQQVKNEIKYKIPERWTKRFHKHDIIPLTHYTTSAVNEERGRESLSSRATPKSDYKRNKQHRNSLQQDLQPLYTQNVNNGQQQQMQSNDQTFKHTHVNNIGVDLKNIDQSKDQNLRDDMADSTDVSKAGDMTRRGSESYIKSSGLCKPQLYDWSEVAHLFENNVVPDELLQISDPIEYNYILVRLKKDFNEKNKSEYLKYMNLQLPYHSRRDEIGGVISHEEWTSFVGRLEGIIDKVKKKRRRMINRRKKKGNKKLPRKTLFKPVPRPNLGNDPLWREVFLDQSSEEDSDDDGPGSDKKDDDMMDIYQLGLKSVASHKSTSMATMFQKNAAQMLGLDSKTSKLPQRAGTTTNKKPGNKTMQNNSNLLDRLTSEELSLPPIMRPLLYEDFRKQHGHNTNDRNKSSTGKLRTAQMNLKETVERFPETKNMLNMRMKDQYYDPFEKEPHKASRMMVQDSSMVQKMDHNYSKKIRRSVVRQQQSTVQYTASILNNTTLNGSKTNLNKNTIYSGTGTAKQSIIMY
eukprot:403331364